MRILFLSRANPPVIGGIEKQNFEIYKALSTQVEIQSVVNTRGKKFLLPFMLLAIFKTFRLRKNYDIILLGDGVLALVAFIIRYFSRVPVVCIVHGLDITYDHFLYRKIWLKSFFRCIDHFIAVGNETIRQAGKRGIDTKKFSFVPNGVDTGQPFREHDKKDLKQLLGIEPMGPVLLSLGRLVKRKGVLWFIKNVMPALDPSIVYIIAGDGTEAEKIRQTIKSSSATRRIHMLGNVSETEKKLLLSSVDIFIQPNVRVPDDMEGFGLVVLEAALHARPVVASRLEGLMDAVIEGKTGILLEPENSELYIRTIERLLENSAEIRAMGRSARRFVLSNCTWQKVAGRYLQIIENVVNSARNEKNRS
jgi:phosphatidylinositol alpha-1,6-mannosyltransferase